MRSVAGIHQILAVPALGSANRKMPVRNLPTRYVLSTRRPASERAKRAGFGTEFIEMGPRARHAYQVGSASRRMPGSRYAEDQASARRPGPPQARQATASSEPAGWKTASSVSSRVRRRPGLKMATMESERLACAHGLTCPVRPSNFISNGYIGTAAANIRPVRIVSLQAAKQRTRQ